MSSSVDREVTNTHMSELTLLTHKVKSPYLAFPIECGEVGFEMDVKVAEERESQLPLCSTSSLPVPHLPHLPPIGLEACVFIFS